MELLSLRLVGAEEAGNYGRNSCSHHSLNLNPGSCNLELSALAIEYSLSLNKFEAQL